MIQFDKPYYESVYNQSLHCAITNWKGFCFIHEYREAMSRCLEIVSQTGATSLMINTQLAAYMEEEWDNHWTSFEWLPQVAQTNVRKMAIIVSKEYLANLPQHTIYIPVADQLITGRFFDNTDEATQWIKFFF